MLMVLAALLLSIGIASAELNYILPDSNSRELTWDEVARYGIAINNRENIQVTGILLDLFIFCPSFIYKLVKNVQQNFPNMS